MEKCYPRGFIIVSISIIETGTTVSAEANSLKR